MTGWCPIHDRVYDAEDGLCPRCGTALVIEEAVSERPIAIEQDAEVVTEEAGSVAPRIRRSTSVAGIAAAIVVAFVAGLAFPNTQPDQVAPRADVRAVTADVNVGITRTGAGIGLRLESFTQRGRHIVARVSVPGDPDLSLRDLRSAMVAFRTSTGGEIFEEMGARTTVSGFILEGEVVPREEIPVLGIRIDTLNFRSNGIAETVLDLNGVWPAAASNQPRARSAEGKLEPVHGRIFTVTGLIGWADRLDIGVSLSDANPAWFYEEEWTLLSGTTKVPASGDPPPSMTFIGVPDGFRRVQLRVAMHALTISGLWEWSFV